MGRRGRWEVLRHDESGEGTGAGGTGAHGVEGRTTLDLLLDHVARDARSPRVDAEERARHVEAELAAATVGVLTVGARLGSDTDLGRRRAGAGRLLGHGDLRLQPGGRLVCGQFVLEVRDSGGEDVDLGIERRLGGAELVDLGGVGGVGRAQRLELLGDAVALGELGGDVGADLVDQFP